MLVDILCISDQILLGKSDNKPVSLASKKLFLSGHRIGKILTVGSVDNNAKEFLEHKNEQDCLKLVFVSNNFAYKSALNLLLCDVLSTELYQSEKVKEIISNQYKDKNCPLPKDIESCWSFPKIAKIIVNPSSCEQGMILSSDLKTIVILPLNYLFASEMLEDSVLPLISQKSKNIYSTQTFKTFGISDSDIRTVLADIIRNKDKVSINTFESFMEVDIVLKVQKDNENLQKYAQIVFDRLNKFIYAEEDISLSNALFELLKLNHLTFSAAESITGGNVASDFIKNNAGASDFIKECDVVYSNEAKTKLLNVSPQTLQNYSSVSVETTYEMATGLVQHNLSDIVVATTGYASNECGKQGLCYIAIGDKKAIHVYKNNFAGTREDIINSVTKATYFYLIKKLRKNDFHFEKTTV